jgi:hypothetical protein
LKTLNLEVQYINTLVFLKILNLELKYINTLVSLKLKLIEAPLKGSKAGAKAVNTISPILHPLLGIIFKAP